MRIPKVSNYTSIQDKEVVSLPAMEFTKPSYFFYNEKQRVKFIKKVERLVRSSYEYRALVSYLHTGLGMNFCSFFNNISTDLGKKVGIELHHIPFSLFDIVSIILKKYETEEIPIDPLKIAEEVMVYHYKGMVGLVPLSTTVHQLYHRGDIFIPLQYVDKGFFLFYKEFKDYMENYEGMLRELVALSKKYEMNKNHHILSKHLIYLKNEGYESIPEHIE